MNKTFRNARKSLRKYICVHSGCLFGLKLYTEVIFGIKSEICRRNLRFWVKFRCKQLNELNFRPEVVPEPDWKDSHGKLYAEFIFGIQMEICRRNSVYRQTSDAETTRKMSKTHKMHGSCT